MLQPPHGLQILYWGLVTSILTRWGDHLCMLKGNITYVLGIAPAYFNSRGNFYRLCIVRLVGRVRARTLLGL